MCLFRNDTTERPLGRLLQEMSVTLIANRRLRRLAKRVLDRQSVGVLEWLFFPRRRDSWGGPFNGQSGRRVWFEEVAALLRPSAIIETGTFRGTTTRYFAAVLPGVPIYSVELSRRAFGFARANLFGIKAVRLVRGDSRTFLERLMDQGEVSSGRPFFYLDAHWGDDLPLPGELEIIFAGAPGAVVAIDDFAVPDDPGFGYDDYGNGKSLTIAALGQTFRRLGLTIFFPRLPSFQESGERRGLVVAARAPEAIGALEAMMTLRRWTV